jgi:uncharacterized protein (DUF1499 family)
MGLFSGRPPSNLGARNGRLAPCPASPNCVSSQADPAGDAGHYVAPIAFKGDPQAAWEALRRVVAESERAAIVGEADGYLHAEFASRLMGFVDDLECLLDAPARRIHVRSASRLGYRDFGVNRGRVEALRRRLRDALA